MKRDFFFDYDCDPTKEIRDLKNKKQKQNSTHFDTTNGAIWTENRICCFI